MFIGEDSGSLSGVFCPFFCVGLVQLGSTTIIEKQVKVVLDLHGMSKLSLYRGIIQCLGDLKEGNQAIKTSEAIVCVSVRVCMPLHSPHELNTEQEANL